MHCDKISNVLYFKCFCDGQYWHYEPQNFTSNSALNDLLNETAAKPANGELADWSSMNFKSQMAQSYQQPANNVRPLATSGIDGELVNMNNKAVASTVNAMTKDYSALMKAIDKKKNN